MPFFLKEIVFLVQDNNLDRRSSGQGDTDHSSSCRVLGSFSIPHPDTIRGLSPGGSPENEPPEPFSVSWRRRNEGAYL